LEHETRTAADRELALLVATDRIEKAREGPKQRALPGARRSQQEDALAFVDPQIDST
jgi:hypothetical protein